MPPVRVFVAEADRLCEILLASRAASPLLNVGSSSRAFRETVKPHIETKLFRPLRMAGVTIFHCDLRPGDGIDLTGDILDPAVRAQLKAHRFRCVLLSNLLEHVRDRNAVAAACEEILGPGGLILATVPSSFPYHADPIDTYYRPSPRDLAKIFKGSDVLLAEELAGGSYSADIKTRGSSLWKEMGRTALFALIFFARPRSFLSRAHRWLWYSRPYRVSIALLAVR